MSIKRYVAKKDNTITNAFQSDLLTRATGSNMGASDILEVFSLYGQSATTSSTELSRVLVEFPVTQISSDRTDGNIPASGSVNFYLRMFNARHSEQLPKNFTMNILAVSQSWQEGHGLDMEGYTDRTKDTIEGSNWVNGTSDSNFATANLVLQGGANLASMDAQTFVLTDTDGTSQTFTFDFDGTSLSNGAIGFDGDSNTTDAINSIKTAINNISALKITAGTITAAGDSDSEMTLALTQDVPGYAGNNFIDASGVAHLTSTGFSGGTGAWVSSGGDYHTSNIEMPNYTFSFPEGHEDIELEVTEMVEEWINGTHDYQKNYGFGVFLSSSFEAFATASEANVPENLAGQTTSFYTKRFFSRSSEFFFRRPIIEARWDSRIKDNRGNFFYSSSLAPAEENLNTIFLYNYVRGQLRNIPSVGENNHIYVNIYSGSDDNSGPFGNPLALTRDTVHVSDENKLTITGGFVSTGIYSCSFALAPASPPLEKIFDVWFTASADHSLTTQFFTGSIIPKFDSAPSSNEYTQYVTKITNLKPKYNSNEQARFRVFARPRNFSPTLYAVASKDIEGEIIPSASFEIIRTVDNHTVINNSTGSSDYHTFLSSDVSGSYFDLDMSMLEPGYMYSIKFAYHVSDGWREQEEIFNFRVEDN